MRSATAVAETLRVGCSAQVIQARSSPNEGLLPHEGQLTLNALRAAAALLRAHGAALLPPPRRGPAAAPPGSPALRTAAAGVVDVVKFLLQRPKKSPVSQMWAGGRAAVDLCRGDAVLISPASSFAPEADGADLACLEGVNVAAHLEREFSAAHGRAVPRTQLKQVLTRMTQARAPPPPRLALLDSDERRARCHDCTPGRLRPFHRDVASAC